MLFFGKKPDAHKKNTMAMGAPLTRSQMREATRKRISLISREFGAAFRFLEDHPRSVTFFGSSKADPQNEYYKRAESLAARIVKELGYSVISGGGPGVMEAANKGAFEVGGSSLGITIDLPKKQINNKYLTDYVPLFYFFTRKVALSFSAEAFVFFPGGFGTLDELFELLTLAQTKKIKSVPIILVGRDYWEAFRGFLEKELVLRGMILESDLSILTIEDDEEKVLDIIRRAPPRDEVPFNEADHQKWL